jgi:hypothetical protein
LYPVKLQNVEDEQKAIFDSRNYDLIGAELKKLNIGCSDGI